jgi:hypothetical protein
MFNQNKMNKIRFRQQKFRIAVFLNGVTLSRGSMFLSSSTIQFLPHQNQEHTKQPIDPTLSREDLPSQTAFQLPHNGRD